MPRRIKTLGLGNALEETQRATKSAKKTLRVVQGFTNRPRIKKIIRSGSKN
jgi:hypothetical protein